jgi:hypothetical protein
MHKVDIMLDLITDVVDDDGTWEEKRDRIKAALNANERIDTAFQEFISWFDDGNGDEEKEEEEPEGEDEDEEEEEEASTANPL